MLAINNIQHLLAEGLAINIQDYYNNPRIHTPKGFYFFCLYLSNCPANDWIPSSNIRNYIRSQVESAEIEIDKTDWNPAGWFGYHWYWNQQPFHNEYYEILERKESKPKCYRIKPEYYETIKDLLLIAEISKAIDLLPPDPARRIKTVENRIIRDTALARRVKRIHNFVCQICGLVLDLGNEKRYAESHHLKPLGKPHNGPDIEENIICACPNCHAQLDFGAIEIDRKSLYGLDLHNLPNEYIDYHNENIFGKSGDYN